MDRKMYKLPELVFEYNELEPAISQKQLTIHHDKHHKAYVDKANGLLAQMDDGEFDAKNIAKGLSFNVGGHILHSLFWENLKSPQEKNEPQGSVKTALEEQFDSFEVFKDKFSYLAMTIEGSGWAALTYCPMTERLLLTQIEKHNLYLYPGYKILMVLDMWEHAYYLDYQNEKEKYVESFWKIVDWNKINSRLDEALR
jgi:Fe-Mn family superoxide dismutase